MRPPPRLATATVAAATAAVGLSGDAATSAQTPAPPRTDHDYPAADQLGPTAMTRQYCCRTDRRGFAPGH